MKEEWTRGWLGLVVVVVVALAIIKLFWIIFRPLK
jgi:hypothetical protein